MEDTCVGYGSVEDAIQSIFEAALKSENVELIKEVIESKKGTNTSIRFFYYKLPSRRT